MFNGIPGLNKFISCLSISHLDDLADRCNYFYTVLALIFFSLLIGAKQHFGEPIRCLVDQQYSNSWVGYVHDYCFISERYSLTSPEYEMNEFADFDPTAKRNYENYYQWVPFLLAAEAIAFYVPHLFWRWLQKLSNLDMAVVVEEAVRLHEMVGDERMKAMENLVHYIEQCMGYPFRRLFWAKVTHFAFVGWYSTVVYLLSKLLNITNTIFQLYIVNTFVGDGTFLWGYQLLKNLWTGRDWTNTGYFPRIVYCDYEKYELANIQHKTVQCALAINILNEKVFALLSAWLLLLLAVNTISTSYTTIQLITPALRQRFVLNYLEAFACREAVSFGNQSAGGGSAVHRKEPSDSCLSNVTSASFHSKIRRRLCAIAGECDGDKAETIVHDYDCQNEATSLQRLLSAPFKNEHLVHNFVDEAIHLDGILLLRFIRIHAGGMTASDIIFALWADYVKSKESKKQIYQRRILKETGCEPAWRKEVAMLNGNKYFDTHSPGSDLTAEVTNSLLKSYGDYAHVRDDLNLLSKAYTKRTDQNFSGC